MWGMHHVWLTCCVLLAACVTGSNVEPARPTAWAQPVSGGGVDNWYRVSSDLFRCAQPSADGMRSLQAYGIASVVNLREHHSDADEVAGSDLLLIEIPLKAHDLNHERLVEVLAALRAAPKPLAVHCWHGSDRTGAVVAGWRVAVEGWTPKAALDEMVSGGFGHSFLFRNLRNLIGDLDAERLRADLRAAVSTNRSR